MREAKKNVTISFKVTEIGKVKDVIIDGKIFNKKLLNGLKLLILESKDWQPAIINGKFEEYTVEFDMKI